MSANNIPGLGVGVNRLGKHIVNEALGLADLENDVPVRPDSRWRMASVSKALTSALVGRLMDSGQLALNQSIYKYLKPDVFPRKQWMGRDVDITLGQIMSHTAGLHITDIFKDFESIRDYKNVTETLVQYRDEPLQFEPGTRYNYSNFAWQVVGAVVESVLNENFLVSIDKMFDEIDMNSTQCETLGMILRHRVRDYIGSDSPIWTHPKNSTDGKLLNALIVDDLLSMEAQWPAGGLVSTVDDLLTFGNFMLNSYKNSRNKTDQGLLTSKTVKQIWTPVIEMYHDKFGSHKSSHGWSVTELDQPIECTNKCQMPATIKRLIWKTGGLTGITTIIVIFPDQDLIVTVLSNNSSFQTDIFEAALMVALEFMV